MAAAQRDVPGIKKRGAIMTASDLYSALSDIVGPDFVSAEEYVRRSYTRTPSWIKGPPPAVVARPGTVEEISKIVILANETKTPIIPRGGGASVAGFPLSRNVEQSILLDITRMNRVLELDEENLIVGAECGIVLSDLSTYVGKRGLHMHTVDMPQYIDTLGGALSGFNGGGEPSDLATVGEMGQYLLGLEVVLPTGDVIQTGSGPGTNIHSKRMTDRYPGSPFTTGLFIADAGVFGIKTKAYFYVAPKPKTMVYGGYECDSFDEIYGILSELMRTAPYPYTRALTLNVKGQNHWTLFYGIRGSESDVASRKEVLDNICKSGGARESEAQEAMSTLMRFSGRQLGKWYASRGKFLYFEHVFGKSEGPGYLRQQMEFVRETFKENGLNDLVTDSVTYMIPKERHSFIMGQVFFFDENKLTPEMMDTVHNISMAESTHVLENGGFLEGNQGWLTLQSASVWSESYRRFMKTLKAALDPNDIMNPGLWRL